MATAGAFNPAQNIKLQVWKKRVVDSMTVFVPRDRAALWTGVGAAKAREFATARGLMTLEMTADGKSLESGKFGQLLDADFGKGPTDERAVVWLWVSEKFASGLQGKVTVLAKQGELAGMKAHDERMQKALFDELMAVDVLSPLRRNPSVTEIIVIEVGLSGRPTWVVTIPRSGRWH